MLSLVLHPDIVEVIRSIPLPEGDKKDYFVWGSNPSGRYTIKSATDLLDKNENSHTRAPLFKKI